MNSPPNLTARLDWALFSLRWLLVLGVFALALLLPSLPDLDAAQQGPLLLVGAAGVLLALGNLLVVLAHDESARPGIFFFFTDTAYVLLVFLASGGLPAVLLAAGALPVITVTLRLRGTYGALAAILLAVLAPLLYSLLIAPGEPLTGVLLAAAGLLLIAAFVTVPAKLAALGLIGQQQVLRERMAEAERLRSARERARVIYEMTATLNSTLKYADVLEKALDVGVLGLREMNPDARLTSVVFLFNQHTGKLRIGSARRLPRADMDKQIPGQRGILGLALQQAEPVFAADAQHDPELQYFVALQDAQSVLCLPLRAGFDSFGALLYGSTQPDAFSRDHIELLTAVANQVTIALQNAALYQDILEEKNRIIDVEEEARKQLSRDLHDGPTQQVSAIAMRLNYIRRLLERRPEEVPMELEKAEDLARQTTKEIRHMLFTLRPYILETQGLVAALGELASKMKDNYGQNVVVKVQENVEAYIDSGDQSVIFNIVDEAANNARKHAQAETIYVRLARRDEHLIIEIEDNGVGFDMGAVEASYDTRGSLGMVNLRERAELINGRLRIESAEGKGTKVTVVAPLRDSVLRMLRGETMAAPAIRPNENNAPARTPTGTLLRAPGRTHRNH